MKRGWTEPRFSFLSLAVMAGCLLPLLLLVLFYPFRTGPDLSRDIGFPLTYDGWTDVGPPFTFFYWWALVFNLASALGIALVVGVGVDALLRRKARPRHTGDQDRTQ
jgi:hypothetical protein